MTKEKSMSKEECFSADLRCSYVLVSVFSFILLCLRIQGQFFLFPFLIEGCSQLALNFGTTLVASCLSSFFRNDKEIFYSRSSLAYVPFWRAIYPSRDPPNVCRSFQSFRIGLRPGRSLSIERSIRRIRLGRPLLHANS